MVSSKKKPQIRKLIIPVTDTNKVYYKDNMFKIHALFNNVILEISPYVILRLIRYAKANGYIVFDGTVTIPYNRKRDKKNG